MAFRRARLDEIRPYIDSWIHVQQCLGSRILHVRYHYDKSYCPFDLSGDYTCSPLFSYEELLEELTNIGLTENNVVVNRNEMSTFIKVDLASRTMT